MVKVLSTIQKHVRQSCEPGKGSSKTQQKHQQGDLTMPRGKYNLSAKFDIAVLSPLIDFCLYTKKDQFWKFNESSNPFIPLLLFHWFSCQNSIHNTTNNHQVPLTLSIEHVITYSKYTTCYIAVISHNHGFLQYNFICTMFINDRSFVRQTVLVLCL